MTSRWTWAVTPALAGGALWAEAGSPAVSRPALRLQPALTTLILAIGAASVLVPAFAVTGL